MFLRSKTALTAVDLISRLGRGEAESNERPSLPLEPTRQKASGSRRGGYSRTALDCTLPRLARSCGRASSSAKNEESVHHAHEVVATFPSAQVNPGDCDDLSDQEGQPLRIEIERALYAIRPDECGSCRTWRHRPAFQSVQPPTVDFRAMHSLIFENLDRA
jgi:hypothetical protein